MESLPCTGPDGSKRVKVKASTYSSSGTPYCRPSETAMAKLLRRERSAAPSLCMSMKISPVRHALALAHHHDALDHLLHHLLRERARARGRRLLDESLDEVVVLLVVG